MPVSLRSESDGEILTIAFAEARISDEVVAGYLQEELIELVLSSREPRILRISRGCDSWPRRRWGC